MSITCLLFVLEVRDGKPSYRKSWDVNFLVWLEFFIGPLLQDRARILYLQYFFNYVLTYFLHLNNYLVTFLHNTICRAQLFCPFLLSASEFLSNMLFNYHLLYFCTALSLIIMLSSHYHLHKSKTLIQLTQCPFRGTLLLFIKTSHRVLGKSAHTCAIKFITYILHQIYKVGKDFLINWTIDI